MQTSIYIVATALFSAVSAQSWPEPPPTTAAASTIKDCTYWNVVSSGQTCESIASDNGITLAQFRTYNPVVGTGSTCPLVLGNSYCVESNYGIPPTETITTTPPPVTTTSSSGATPTTTGNGVQTPVPFQPGMVSNCNKFHFVTTGQGCPQVAALYGITTAQVIQYNPEVGSDCRFIWLDTYVCVGVIGGPTSTTSPTTRPATTTSAGNGISTPTPYMPGSVSNCNKFYFTKSGDSCPSIATAFNIPVAAVIAYNPQVGSDCNFLWLDTYICVGVVGGSTFTTTTTRRVTTTTTAGNGIATPTPYLPGSATNCDVFHFVRSGETCDTITASRGVSSADFLRFNPQISSDCRTGLWLDTWVCVSIIGHNLSISTTTTRPPPTTTRGNGITTPTPYQPGMVSNCRLFEYVDSGETCASIAAARKITVANIVAWNPEVGSDCRFMWLNAYICVGVL